MFYLDASAAVAAVTQEVHSEAIWRFLDDHAADPILCSGWTATEVASALSIKVRTGDYSIADRAFAWNNWRRFRSDNLADVAVNADHFEAAAGYCDRPDLGLRAGDALHIAIAQSGGMHLVTFDRIMAAAALRLGVPIAEL